MRVLVAVGAGAYVLVAGLMFGALFGQVLDDAPLRDTSERWFVAAMCIVCAVLWPLFAVWAFVDRLMKGN